MAPDLERLARTPCPMACWASSGTSIDANGAGDYSFCLPGHGHVLLVLLSPADSESRQRREHGRSIPFPEPGRIT